MFALQPETGELQQECVGAFYIFRAACGVSPRKISGSEGSLGVEMVALGMTSDRHHLINVRGGFQEWVPDPQHFKLTRCWFQTLFFFPPLLGKDDPTGLIYRIFFRWVETNTQLKV